MSCHDNNGKIIKNCFKTIEGVKHLKAYDKIATTNRYPKEIAYTKIKIDVDFTSVDKKC